MILTACIWDKVVTAPRIFFSESGLIAARTSYAA